MEGGGGLPSLNKIMHLKYLLQVAAPEYKHYLSVRAYYYALGIQKAAQCGEIQRRQSEVIREELGWEFRIRADK